jgi:hypothetical protein
LYSQTQRVDFIAKTHKNPRLWQNLSELLRFALRSRFGATLSFYSFFQPVLRMKVKAFSWEMSPTPPVSQQLSMGRDWEFPGRN